ncbi:hypothetical protein, partial [Mesorhizobium sp. M7A.F.Ca.CA.001.12.2.1]|uniref:hypothetical protein n=1 Tax=Mesorhizobium sp. M7A.F.Ca.CA.001.12.2.1 TaxID=2496725 RepID=UPI0013E0581D
LSNWVGVLATRHASPTGLVADVPAPTIIEAAQRMLATRRRDHPHLPDKPVSAAALGQRHA